MKLNNNITIFIDLFLIAFIAIMIINASSPQEKPMDELKIEVSFSLPASNIRIEPVSFIQIDDEIYDIENSTDRMKWTISENSISVSLNYPKDASSLKFDFMIKDDFGTIYNESINYYFNSSKGIEEDGILERNNFYHKSIEIF